MKNRKGILESRKEGDTMNHCKKSLLLLSILLLTAPVFARAETGVQTNLGGYPITCSITRDQAAVGGIHPWDTPEQVINALGSPDHTNYGKGTMQYVYTGKLRVDFVAWGRGGPYIVKQATVFGPWTVGTPGGVLVGMDESVLNDVYGTADTVATKTAFAPKLTEEQNARYRQRYDETVYTYYVNQVTNLSFKVREGVIQNIVIYTTD